LIKYLFLSLIFVKFAVFNIIIIPNIIKILHCKAVLLESSPDISGAIRRGKTRKDTRHAAI